MINQKQLLDKKKLYIYYKKIINFKRIELQKQIENYRKQIVFVKETIRSMKNIKNLLIQESVFLSFFEKKLSNNNHKKMRNIFIFIQTQDDTSIGKYSDKKILEYIKKKIDVDNDIVYVSGLRLFNQVIFKFQNLSVQLLDNLIKESNHQIKNNFSILFEKISEISFTLYADQIVDNVYLLYSDIEKSEKLFHFTILPFNLDDIDNHKLLSQSKNVKNNYANKIFNDFSVKTNHKINFISQITNINETFLKLLLLSLTKYIVINYLLNVCIRKMINIDEEEKNLDQRIKENNMALLKAKKEKATNEMIQIVVAFF